jgi:DNA-binding response OmpR family regulator
MMNSENPLNGKRILVVDDEPDVLETLKEILDMCVVHQAADYDAAIEFMSTQSYDAVILDIQGVNGFELLRHAVSRDFPALMLTAHAATPESLKKSIELGAAAFLPKEYITELKELLEEVVSGGGKRFWWMKSLDRTDAFFSKQFGTDWKEQDAFFKEFHESLKMENS